MKILAYLRALRHQWVVIMSGIGALAVAIASSYGLVQTTTTVWWWLGGVAFFVASYLAWKEEYDHRRRLEDERVGPALLLEYDTSGLQPRWRVTNTGSDALNVTADTIAQGNHFMRLEGIPRIPEGGQRELEFRVFRKDVSPAGRAALGPSKHPVAVLDSALKSNDYPAAEMAQRGHPNIPVRLLYNDPAGRQFETVCTIHWDSFLSKGYVEHVRVRRVAPPTMAERSWRALRDKWEAIKRRFKRPQ